MLIRYFVVLSNVLIRYPPTKVFAHRVRGVDNNTKVFAHRVRGGRQ